MPIADTSALRAQPSPFRPPPSSFRPPAAPPMHNPHCPRIPAGAPALIVLYHHLCGYQSTQPSPFRPLMVVVRRRQPSPPMRHTPAPAPAFSSRDPRAPLPLPPPPPGTLLSPPPFSPRNPRALPLPPPPQALFSHPLPSLDDHYVNEEWFGITTPKRCGDSIHALTLRPSLPALPQSFFSTSLFPPLLGSTPPLIITSTKSGSALRPPSAAATPSTPSSRVESSGTCASSGSASPRTKRSSRAVMRFCLRSAAAMTRRRSTGLFI